jgi:hypothetical protein
LRSRHSTEIHWQGTIGEWDGISEFGVEPWDREGTKPLVVGIGLNGERIDIDVASIGSFIETAA